MGEAVSAGSSIPGVRIAELREIRDDRGAVLRMLRSDQPEFTRFGECYFSEIRAGAVKAWKRQKRRTQNLAVPVGRIRLVLVDDRGPVGRHEIHELGRPDAYRLLTIPPGIWYGFQGLGPGDALVANCSDLPHQKGEVDERQPQDLSMPAVWLKNISPSG